MDVVSDRGYPTNNYCFYSKAHNDRCIIQNDEIILITQAMHISSTKNNKSVFANMSYYEVIENI